MTTIHGLLKTLPKAMAPIDRIALDTQIADLVAYDSPAMASLLKGLRKKQAADDLALLLEAAAEMGLPAAVRLLEEALPPR